jgi:hypothetical protein
MLRYASIEEAWQRSTPPVRRTYPADERRHTTNTGPAKAAEALDPVEGPGEYAEYDRLEGQRPEVPRDYEPEEAAHFVTVPPRRVDGTDTCMYDVMLYAISGIVLVLMLEQFVQMGIKLR